MTEGWHGDDYLLLFDTKDRADLSRRYDLDSYVGGYEIGGLLGWDDFILHHQSGELVTVPTVPLDPKYLAPMRFTFDARRLQPDHRFTGKIKWYVKPIVFGGDAVAGDNITWITLEQHIELVKWWNKLYKSMT